MSYPSIVFTGCSLNAGSRIVRSALLLLTFLLATLTPLAAVRTIQFARTNLTVNELDAYRNGLPLELNMSPPFAQEARVRVVRVGGSTLPKEDYHFVGIDSEQNGSALIGFYSGMATRTFWLLPVDDGVSETNETVILGLTNLPPGVVLGAQSNVFITILNGSTRFGISAPNFAEGQQGSIDFIRYGDAEAAFTVALSVEGTAIEEEDFSPAIPRTISFAPGERMQSMVLNLTDDDVMDSEVREWFSVRPIDRSLELLGSQTRFEIQDNQFPTTLDLSFDPAVSGWTINAIPQNDGKLLVSDFTHLRLLNSDGSLDRILPVTLVTGADVAQQLDGKVLAFGWSPELSSEQPSLLRLRLDGSLDQEFSPPSGSKLNWGAGKILPTAGGAIYLFDQAGRLIRLKADGREDSEFQPFQFEPGAEQIVLAVDAQERVVVSRWRGGPAGYKMFRLDPNGSIDPTFNPQLRFNEQDGTSPVRVSLIQPDGRILIAGRFTEVNGNSRSGGVVRLNENGTIDESFQFSGSVMGQVDSVLPGTNGTFIVAGFRHGVQRLASDGTVFQTIPVLFNEGQCVAPEVTIISVSDDWVLLRGHSYLPFRNVNGLERTGLVRIRLGSAPRTEVAFQASRGEVFENSSIVQMDVVRLGDVNASTVVSWRTGDGTAKQGEDYEDTSSTLHFAAFEQYQQITVPILNDGRLERDESFGISFAESGGVEAFGPALSLNIVDDEMGFFPSAIQRLSSGVVEVIFSSPRYEQIEVSSDLRTWRPAKGNIDQLENNRYRLQDADAATAPVRFYRLVRPTPFTASNLHPLC